MCFDIGLSLPVEIPAILASCDLDPSGVRDVMA